MGRYLSRAAVVLGLSASTICAQSLINGARDFRGMLDASNASSTKPVKAGLLANRPVNCGGGELYLATDAQPGRQLFVCYSANTWVQSGYSQGLDSAKPSTCTVGQMYFAVDAPAGTNLRFCTAANTWTSMQNAAVSSGVTVGTGCDWPPR